MQELQRKEDTSVLMPSSFVKESCGSPRERRNSRRSMLPYHQGAISRLNFRVTVVASDSDYSVKVSDELVIAEGKTSGNATITLPSLSDYPRGQAVLIKNVDPLGSWGLMVTRSGSDTIENGATTYSLSQYQCAMFCKAQDVGGTEKWLVLTTTF